MNQIFAKLRLYGNNKKYRKLVAAETEVYESKEKLITSSYDYSPGANIEEGEWFKITDFSKTNYALDIMQLNYESVDCVLMTKEEFEHIDYIFTNVEKDIYFQKIGRSKLIRKKGIICFGENYEYIPDAGTLIINDSPDAIYDTEKDVLYFQKLESISSIFKNITQLYRSATDTEVKEFLQSSFISLQQGFSIADVKIPNRKRIALARENLKKLEDRDKERVFSYINEYCPSLTTEENKFCVGSEDDLKMILLGIAERFYTTPVSSEKRLANSVINLEQSNNR